MERIMCATCKHRGVGPASRDGSGIQHCSLLSLADELKCIARNHQKWEPEDMAQAKGEK